MRFGSGQRKWFTRILARRQVKAMHVLANGREVPSGNPEVERTSSIFRHVLCHPTIYIIGAPSDVIGLSAGEEDGNRGDLFRFSKTAQRNLFESVLRFLLILEDR